MQTQRYPSTNIERCFMTRKWTQITTQTVFVAGMLSIFSESHHSLFHRDTGHTFWKSNIYAEIWWISALKHVFTCFLGIRHAEMGFTSPFGHVLIHFSLLNTLKPVLKFPEIRFWKGMIQAPDFGYSTSGQGLSFVRAPRLRSNVTFHCSCKKRKHFNWLREN